MYSLFAAIQAGRFSPEGSLVLLEDYDRQLYVMKCATGELIYQAFVPQGSFEISEVSLFEHCTEWTAHKSLSYIDVMMIQTAGVLFYGGQNAIRTQSLAAMRWKPSVRDVALLVSKAQDIIQYVPFEISFPS